MKKVYVVPHSHWDREWYFNLEDSNILLGENLTHLIIFLENHEKFSSYSFDAQASILDEYMKIYPQNFERLSALIREKRIFVGPWYTQTDSLLVNKESVIRNLLYGITICEKFGHSMNVGYLPDIFGQNQYLPSIFRGFNIKSSILQRGIYNDQLCENLNFNWVSPDGEKITTNNIFLGYGPGKFLESSDEYIKEKLLPMLEKLAKLNRDSDNLLLPAGGDQVLIREEFPKIIEELNEKKLGYEFILSNYEDFIQDTWNKSDFKNTISGELRGCQKSRIHRTIGSQRYDIKFLNSRVENKILRILEPLALIGTSNSLNYPQAWIDYCWKQLFDVHAHDSIGGCNSDSTNRDILSRLEKVERVVDANINMIKKQIVTGISKKLGKNNILTIFNTLPKPGKKYYEAVIFTKSQYPYISHLDGKKLEFSITNSQYITGGKRVVVTATGEVEEELPGYYRSHVLLKDLGLEGLSYATLFVNEGDPEETNSQIDVGNTLENKFYKIELKDEKLNLLIKKRNEIIEDFLSFESSADDGDSYDYSPKIGDTPLCFSGFEKNENSKNGHFITEFRGMREFHIQTIIDLKEDSELINITHKIHNREENHRLRTIIKGNLEKFANSYSDSGFSLVKHPVKEDRMQNWREKGYAEAPVPIYNMENMVVIYDEKKVLGFYTEGLKEYEILKTDLAVTLFRSVGLLGKDNLLWRPGRASGINNKVVCTPDAQMKGELLFNYALSFTSKVNIYENYRFLDEYQRGETSYHLQNLNTFEERVERFEIPLPVLKADSEKEIFNIENENLFVSVCKKAHKDQGTIVRLFNPGDEAQLLSFEENVEEVNLKEDKIGLGKQFEIKAKSYKTFKL
ncbi:MAG: glycoside hydrolase family 38 C-terminal domain-containing protein [Fusobacteriaceae bacterium]